MEKRMISIEGLDKAAVLAALFNRATTGGMGFAKYSPDPMTAEEAREILRQFDRVTRKILFWEFETRPAERYIKFDYLAGRAMKVDLTSDKEFDASEYDKPCYNGDGAAEEVILGLRSTGDVNPPVTQTIHAQKVIAARKEFLKGG